MFTQIKQVAETKTIKKLVRANMKVALYLTGTTEIRNYEVVSSSKGVLVLRDVDYAFNIVATEDLSHFEMLLSNKSFSVEQVVITANNKDYVVKQNVEDIYYEVETQVATRKPVNIKVTDLLDISASVNTRDDWEWTEATVIDVTPTQLLVKIVLDDVAKYVLFDKEVTTVIDDVTYEIENIAFNK